MTLAASLAALGCTTNHNLGNGTPTRSGPEVRTAPTSGVTSGGETNTPPVNPPMTSSYNRAEILPRVTARASGTSRVIRRSPDEAAAIMAGRQALRGRYLGVVSPGTSGRAYASSNIQTYVNPAMLTNPQLTVNSSISSQPTGVISSGAEGTVVDTSGAVTSAATLTPTTASTGLALGTFAGTTPSPTLASAGNPTVTNASVGLGGTTAQTTTTAATTATTTATTAASTVTTSAVGVRTGTVTSPVRVMRGTAGNVTVTNVSTAPVTASGRSQ